MLLLLSLTVFSRLVTACLRIAEFSNCTTTAGQTSANCNNLVTDIPTLEYYQCLCNAGQSSLSCYAICSDDAQLQLQLTSIKQSVSSTCQGVSNLQSQGFTTSASISPTTLESSSSSWTTSLTTASESTLSSSSTSSGTSTSTSASTATSSIQTRSPNSLPRSTGAGILLATGGTNPNANDGGPKVSVPHANLPASRAKASRLILTRTTLLENNLTVFRFASFNTPNLHFIEDAPKGYFGNYNKRGSPTDFEIRDALRSIAQLGGRVTRCYTFCFVNSSAPDSHYGHFAWIPGYPLNAPQGVDWEVVPGTNGEVYANRQLFETFDLVLASAAEVGLRIIVPFIDKWPFWGGVPEFVKWFGESKADSFWTSESVRGGFKAVLRYILERRNSITGISYKEDPAVLMWELGNELSLEVGGRIPTEWTIEMAQYVKSVDPNHLVKDGSNTGAFGHQVEVLQSPFVDVVGSHYYRIPRPLDPSYIPPFPADDSFASRSVVDSAFVASYGKVFIIDEYGLQPLEWTTNLLKATLENPLVSGTLLWSLRSHSRDGGFYTHDESPTQRAYHSPGFPYSVDGKFNTEDEAQVMENVKFYGSLMSNAPLRPFGSFSFMTEAPNPAPVILFGNSTGIRWRGSTGARQYIVERADVVGGPFSVVSENSTDAVYTGSLMYRPPQNTSGWFRVTGSNAFGKSDPSDPFLLQF
ncbi:UNVERIFIED_CONTAM: hypothetical protein HDU68_007076 [Siphonaria sp. JEL0065]|nr:hypothetical protein HDU68_007076 [Siphonaria sp. JEL0065]